MTLSAKLRAMGLPSHKGLAVIETTSWSDIMAEINRMKPEVIFVDTLNLVSRGAAHALAVLKDVTRVTRTAQQRPAVVLVAHANGHGIVGQDRSAKHYLDAVLRLSRTDDLLTLTTEKNRHGPDRVSARYVFRGACLEAVRAA